MRALRSLACLMAACGAAPAPPLTQTTRAGLSDGAPASPAEAIDLDPDPGVLEVDLVAAPQIQSVDGKLFDGFAYNGQTPGPTLRLAVGETLVAHLKNNAGIDTSIHWHGMDVPYAMDGAGWQVAPVKDGESFTYTFTPTRAGTFWYHPHFNTDHQVDGGLYGVVVVEDPQAPVADLDLVLVFDTFGEFTPPDEEVAKADDGGHGHSGGTEGHGLGFEGAWTVNGLRQPTMTLQGGQRVRARLLNASSAGYLDLEWPGIRQIAGDQGLSSALGEPERLLLSPGDRAEVEWLVGEAGFEVHQAPYSLHGGSALGDESVLLTVAVDTPAAAPAGLAWAFDGALPTPDPGYTDLFYVFSGSPRFGEWLINGEKYPEVTLDTVPAGEERVVEVRNLSSTEHPFHLHGMAFEVLSVDGLAPANRTLEDTINLPIQSSVRFLLKADNPGDWMAHCHILSHAEEGMMTVIRVQGP